MSETDSFIDEVSEEVRRDQLFGYYKRYGWIALLVVLGIVGTAGFFEWQKAQVRTASEKAGDAILTALEQAEPGERAAAFAELSNEDSAKQSLLKIHEASMLIEDGRSDEAVAVLETLANAPNVATIYADLARMRLVLLRPEDEATSERLDVLTTVGRPFRLLAIEQRALSHVRSGDTKSALLDLALILEDPSVTQDLRQRSQRMIVVLGGELPQSSTLLPLTENG